MNPKSKHWATAAGYDLTAIWAANFGMAGPLIDFYTPRILALLSLINNAKKLKQGNFFFIFFSKPKGIRDTNKIKNTSLQMREKKEGFNTGQIQRKAKSKNIIQLQKTPKPITTIKRLQNQNVPKMI